ncbi:MAG: hypothetical protein J0L75_14965 [Spirochaetes bacterium]|nr:hypothetical protein [Spirochaetota bacterium]
MEQSTMVVDVRSAVRQGIAASARARTRRQLLYFRAGYVAALIGCAASFVVAGRFSGAFPVLDFVGIPAGPLMDALMFLFGACAVGLGLWPLFQRRVLGEGIAPHEA